MSASPDRGTASMGMDPDFGIHAVHRLDKETSGLILLAGRRDVFHYLSKQFASGRVIKTYLAVVHGLLSAPAGEGSWGSWQWPLTVKAGGRRHVQGNGERKPSKTLYRVLGRGQRYTLIQCQPLSGRIHQIRRHCALAGHAIVGDQRYGSLRACRYLEHYHGFTRLGLHADTLEFAAPPQGENNCVTSAGLPEEMGNLWEG